MATIEKRKGADGAITYRARVRKRGYPEYSETFLRRTDAEAWARQVEVDLQRGRYLPSNEARRRTFNDAVDRFLTDVAPYRTRRADTSHLVKQLAWWREQLGNYALVSITPAVIADCKAKLLAGTTRYGRPRTPATVNRYLAALSAVFKVAVREWHWLESNPVSNVSRGQESPGRVRWLDGPERAALLAACEKSENPDLLTIVLFAISTGARAGEIYALRWRSVDLVAGRAIFEKTKNGERRAVPLAGRVLDLLRARAKIRRLDTDLVFPVSRNVIAGAFRRAVAEAGIKDFRFHDLRHSAASYLAQSGATTAEIAAVLGHKTLAMVRRYTHLGDLATVGAVARMIEKTGL
jgi:integrase